MPDLDAARRSITATLDEIVQGEQAIPEARDPEEWMMLRDIVARIERRLAAQQKDVA